MTHSAELGENEERRSVWKRGLAMLLFTIAFALAETVLAILTLIQFVWLLVNSEPNRFIHDFGKSLSQWIADVVQFQTCVSDRKPFPWKDWPSSDKNNRQPDLFTDHDDIE